MILSESEKNRIRGLYGLVTEADASTPPPDESVLVTKKNPFKYDEYKDFRQPYSKKLKEGKKFFTIADGQYDNIKKDLDEYLKKSINGKTFRASFYNKSSDKLYKFGDNFDLKGVDVSWNSFTERELNNSDIINTIFFSHNKQIYPKTETYLTTKTSGYPAYINLGYETHKFDKWMYPISNFLNQKTSEFIVNSPDEYWELREIKREKTDF